MTSYYVEPCRRWMGRVNRPSVLYLTNYKSSPSHETMNSSSVGKSSLQVLQGVSPPSLLSATRISAGEFEWAHPNQTKCIYASRDNVLLADMASILASCPINPEVAHIFYDS